MKEIHDPTVGLPKKRIVEKATNCIVVKKLDVSQLVDSAFYETKGEGAKKLSKQMSQIYRGLSRRIIQHNLNSMKQPQKVKPLFQNKAPLRPIRASKVQERHQVDLVSMVSMPATIDGDTYKYIMAVFMLETLKLSKTLKSSRDDFNVLDNFNVSGIKTANACY